MQDARRTPLNGDEPTPEPDEVAEADPETPARRRTPHLVVFWCVALTGLAIDQWTKHWASTSLEGRGTVDVFGDWLGWHLTFNSGASFSMGTSYTELLSVFAIVATIVVVVLSFRLRSMGWTWGLGFLLAGVTGNLTDRLFRAPGPLEGHVVDFIALPNWPIFNVADICINIAAGLIIIQTIRGIRLNGTFHD